MCQTKNITEILFEIPELVLTYEQIAVFTSRQNTVRLRLPTDTFRPQPAKLETEILAVNLLRDINAVGADDVALRFVRYAVTYLVSLNISGHW